MAGISPPSSGGGGGGAVDSVNAQTGVVVLDAADVGAIDVGLLGAANGVAQLDATGFLDVADLPASTASTMRATSGAPTVLATDIVGDFAFDATASILYGPLTGTPVLAAAWINGGTSGAVITSIQPLDSDLTAIAALTSAANKVPYSTGTATWALTDFTAAGRALVDDADASAQRTTLGLGTAATTAATAYEVAGAAAAAQAASQPLDSDLTSIAALTTTSYGRAFLALADAAAAQSALALGIDVDPAPPTGLIGSTLPRYMTTSGNVPAANTGNIRVAGRWLVAGSVIGRFKWFSGGTPATTPTHSYMCLTDSAGVVVATTADNLTLALGANVVFNWAVATVAAGAATSYTVPTTGFYYIGLGISATTVPTLTGVLITNTSLSNETPTSSALGGASTSPPTIGATLTIGTTQGHMPWFAVFVV